MNDLMHYKLEPAPELKRKIDYYITPYNNRIQCGRGMTFGDDENPREVDPDAEAELKKK